MKDSTVKALDTMSIVLADKRVSGTVASLAKHEGNWLADTSNEEATQSVRALFPDMDKKIDLSRTNVGSLMYTLSRVDMPTLTTQMSEWEKAGKLGGPELIAVENTLEKAGYKFNSSSLFTRGTEFEQIQKFVNYIGTDTTKI